jgi:iron(III) transport system ATP-binding protein
MSTPRGAAATGGRPQLWGQRGTAGATIPRSLAFEGIGFSIGALCILDTVSLTIAAREVVALLGPSGCGKTTLLRVTAGVERQTSGRLLVDGVEIAGDAVWTPPEKRGVGLVFQDYALFPHLTNLRNVMFGLAGLATADAERVARRALDRVGLAEMAEDYPHMLSGGEQQRVALARAVAPRPGIVLMDEPFSNLDRRMRETVGAETIALVRETGATAIMVTHDPEEAMRHADRIALMRAGRIVQQGRAEDIYRRPADLFAARFFCDFNEFAGRVSGGAVATPFGRVPAPGLAEGQLAVALFRPQGLALEPPGSGQASRIVERKFLGESDVLTLAVYGVDHHMRVRVRGGDGPEPGREVGVTAVLDDVLVFPAVSA